MRVLGIDLAASHQKTGAALLRSGERRWVVEAVSKVTDDDLVVRARDVDVIGVDSPLGWPVAFVAAVRAQHERAPWPGSEDRLPLTHRETDRAVETMGRKFDRVLRRPLSVSANTLGSVAMRCALLQRRWAEEAWFGEPAPRDGTGRLVEVYPVAALAAWNIDAKDYKHRTDKGRARDVRGQVVDCLRTRVGERLDLSAVRERCVESDHVLDALISALVALAARVNCTYTSEDARTLEGAKYDPNAIAAEGWIHVPCTPIEEMIEAADRCVSGVTRR